MKQINRRKFIKQTTASLGAGSVGASLVERALAQDTNIKRVIFWYVPEGCAQQAFWPQDTGALYINPNAKIGGVNVESRNGSIRDYINKDTASYCLQGLKKHESKISLYSGFQNLGTGFDDDHKKAVSSALTGNKYREGSIDQLLGKALQGSSPLSAISSATYGHHSKNSPETNDYMSPIRRVGGGTVGYGNWNPMQTYNFVFGSSGVPAPSGGGGGAIAYSDRHATVKALRAMESRIESIRCVGGEEARNRYEILLNSYASLEKQTQALIDADSRPGTADVRFDIPNGWANTSGNLSDKSKYWNNHNNFEKLVDIAIDTTVAALALDKTRVSTMQFSASGNDAGPVNHDHYKTIGITDFDSGDVNDHYMGHESDPKRRRNQARIFRWYYSKMSQLIDKLIAIPEGAGNMFDSTLIVTASEFSMYNHRTHDMPYIIAGGLGGKVKTGQYLDVRNGNNFRHSSQFFHGVAGALDVNLPRFGESSSAYTGLLE